MKVADAIDKLQELPLESEICIQWFDKAGMESFPDVIADAVWSKAVEIMDKSDSDDFMYEIHSAIEDAILVQ